LINKVDETRTDIEYSIILPICHAGELLCGALTSLLNMDFPPERFEVLVAGLNHDTQSRKIVQAVEKIAALDVAIKLENDPVLFLNESINVHEDVELAQRIEQSGRSILYEPQMRIVHKRDTTVVSFAHRNFKMAQVRRMLGIHQLARIALVAFVLRLSFVTHAAIFSTSSFQWAAFFYVLFYFFLLLTSAVQGLKRTKCISLFAMIPWLAFTLHLCRGLGFLWPTGKCCRSCGIAQC
jgi:hypothetical protein